PWPHRSLPVQLPAEPNLLAAAVDGRWLERPALGDDNQLALPVPAGPRPAVLELLYTTPGPAPGPWPRLRSPAPELPVAPAAFERRWLLPPGVLPLGDGRALPLPGGAAEAGPRAASARLLDLLALGPALPLPGRRPEPRPAAGGASRPRASSRPWPAPPAAARTPPGGSSPRWSGWAPTGRSGRCPACSPPVPTWTAGRPGRRSPGAAARKTSRSS